MSADDDMPLTQEDPHSLDAFGTHDSEPPATQEDDDDDDNDYSLKRPLDASSAASSSAAPHQPPVHMARRAEVAWLTRESRSITIDRLPQEAKKLKSTALARMPSEEGIGRKALNLLLQPRTWTPPADGAFPLVADEIIALCDLAQDVFEAEPTLLQCSAPIKVFGDIHGQYADLMRLFRQFGSPSRDTDGGDISVCDYLFLGDYVDRGRHSLEVVCLLLALKLSFPKRIFLVRGNHESPEVNARDGFLHECVQRLGGRASGVAAWRRINLLFEWLPMAALVNGVILGVHGGIGRDVDGPQQIAAMQRPLRMGGEYAQLLLDLLWSDPTASDEIEGVHINAERGAPVVCFGPDRVQSFLRANGLSVILRAHECVMDGFQRFAGGQLITVFSATNYCNRWNNAGAVLLVGKDLEIVPKIIYPIEDLEDAWIEPKIDGPTARTAATEGGEEPGGKEPGGNEPSEHLREMRPPTPPRDAPQPAKEPTAAASSTSADTSTSQQPAPLAARGGAAAVAASSGVHQPQPMRRTGSLMGRLASEELDTVDEEKTR